MSEQKGFRPCDHAHLETVTSHLHEEDVTTTAEREPFFPSIPMFWPADINIFANTRQASLERK